MSLRRGWFGAAGLSLATTVLAWAFLCPGAVRPGGGRDANSADTGMPLPVRSDVYYGPIGCPVFVYDSAVYDLRSFRQTQTLEGAKWKSADFAALSPDGNWLAAANPGSYKGADAVIRVYSLSTGKSVQEFRALGGEKIEFLAFSGDKNLVVAGVPGKRTVEVREAQTGKLIRTFPVGGGGISSRRGMTARADGRYLAVAENDRIALYDLATGASNLSLATPPGIATRDANRVRAGASLSPTPARPLPPAAQQSLERSQSRLRVQDFYQSVEALAFAPDGNELAGVFGNAQMGTGVFENEGDARIVQWDLRGNITFDRTLSLGRSVLLDLEHPFLQWTADGRGWLIGRRFLVDRASQQVVAIVSFPSQQLRETDHFLDANRLAYVTWGQDRVKVAEFPWASLRKSLALVAANAPASLRPGQSVSVQIDPAAVREEEGRTRKALLEEFTKRLAAGGIGVADNQPLSFVLKLRQAQGDIARGEEKGNFVLELRPKVGDPVWRRELPARVSRGLTVNLNDRSLQDGTAEGFVQAIHPPWFVPTDPNAPVLPAVLRFD